MIIRQCVVAFSMTLCLSSAVSARSLASRADRLVGTYAREGKFSGAVLVARNGKILFRKGYGLANSEWGIPNTPSTKFEIASLTKQFTAAAILQLAEKGKLRLEDPALKFYSDAPAHWSKITIHHLLTHISGISNNRLEDFRKGIAAPYTPSELIATFRDKPLEFEPGTGWKYSNPNYYLLGYIIERVSGKAYAQYLQEDIFDSLGMKDSGIAPTLAVVRHLADGYTKEGGVLRHRDYFDRSLELGAGGIHSTVEDLFRWDQALAGGKVLAPKWQERMFTPQTKRMGYGWFIQTRNGKLAYYHEGGDPGYAAFILRIPADHVMVIVLSNFEEAPVREIAEKLATEVSEHK